MSALHIGPAAGPRSVTYCIRRTSWRTYGRRDCVTFIEPPNSPDIIRPPGTLVPKALCFTADVFFLFLSPRDLRVPSADRRETLPHDRNMGALYNASPKVRGPYPQRNWGPKTCAISYNFRLRSRISPKRVKISKIGKRIDRERVLPRSMKKNVR